ncbi:MULTISPECIES: hypothetical protein [unclassified Mycobacterium]|uniref:hypothetical protein n=1 Tax=unclassified Mycobacterium TaxID=2642494 RepID=UPI000A7EC285|nr:MULTISPECIES: hypothetical protein [unclassified Mycobacterium]
MIIASIPFLLRVNSFASPLTCNQGIEWNDGVTPTNPRNHDEKWSPFDVAGAPTYERVHPGLAGQQIAREGKIK